MNDTLDLSSPEYCKSRIKRFLFTLLKSEQIKNIPISERMERLEIFCAWLLQLEAVLWKLYHQSPTELKKIKEIYVTAADKRYNTWEKALKLSWPLKNINFPIADENVKSISLFEFFNSLPLVSHCCSQGLDVAASLSRTLKVTIPEADFSDIYPFFERGAKKFRKGLHYSIIDSTGKYQAVFDELQYGNASFLLPRISKRFLEDASPLPVFHEELIAQNPDSVIFLFNTIPTAAKFQRISDKIFHERNKANVAESIKKITVEFQHAKDILQNHQNQTDFALPNIGDAAKYDKQNLQGNISDLSRKLEEAISRLQGHYQPPAPDVVFSTYSSVGQLQNTDYLSLKNHPAILCIPASQDENTWLREALYRLSVFYQMGIAPGWVVYIEEHLDYANFDSCGLRVYSATEIVLQAVERDLDLSAIDPKLAQAAFQLLNKTQDNNFLIDDILDRRSILMITAASGVGKSLFAMSLGYALAVRGKLINGWKIPQKCKVLYICDAELDERTLAKHEEKFKKLYNLSCKPADFIIEHADRWDLNTDSCQQQTEELIEKCVTKGTVGQQVSVLILDSLNRLAPGAHQEKKWERLSLWLTSLRQKGLSIILVHHAEKENKTGYLGTSKIQNDIDAHIYLATDEERNVLGHIALKMQMKKNRRSWLDRSQKKLTLIWNEKHPHWIEGKSEILNWHQRPDTRIEEITRMRNAGMTSKQIADRYNVSPRTVENFIFHHPEIPKINRSRKSHSQCPILITASGDFSE